MDETEPAAQRDYVARLSHVTLRYDNGTQALEDLSLDVACGEHLCVLGSNGSGKSTLGSVLCGLLAPDAGTVTLIGERVFDAERTQPIDFEAYQRVRQRLGLVFQNPDDQIVTTVVEDDVAFGPENLCLPPEEIGKRVERELKRVAMQGYAKADPTRLSGGQKQRVAIAGALAMEPDLLVLDEPGSLLDVRGRSAIMRVMGRLSATGTAIVHITHFMEEALEADRVVVLNRGHIVLEGTPAQVFSQGAELRALGLEEPFAARLSRKLGLTWTCSNEELQQVLRTSVQEADDDAVNRGRVFRSYTGTSQTKESASPIVRVDHVSYSYNNRQRVLDDASFSLEPGSSVAIVGQTGSGKSTLLRLMCALEVPDAGTIMINGVGTRRKRDRRRLHGTIGYVMQHPERQLFAETVLEDVAFGPRNMGLSEEKVARRCRAALELVGLAYAEELSPFELSGGQQRLCAIAGVLAMRPRLLVLDEPTAGLDPQMRQELRSLLQTMHESGVTVVQVTHSMDDAAKADRVIVLNESRILYDDTPEQVFCGAHADELIQAGLGLPMALQWAQQIGLAAEPLTLDELVCAITEVVQRGLSPLNKMGQRGQSPADNKGVGARGV